MSRDVRFPLLAKVLGWLMLHLLVLSLAFAGFVAWQFRFGLDSLLSGAAGDHLRSFAEELGASLSQSPESAWPQILLDKGNQKGVQVGLHDFRPDPPRPALAGGQEPSLPPRLPELLMKNIPVPPPNVDQRIRHFAPQPLQPPHPPPHADWDGNPPQEGGFFQPPDSPPRPQQDSRHPASSGDTHPVNSSVRPVFLLRGDQGAGYWAGVDLPVSDPYIPHTRRFLLLIRSDTLDGGGMFFDLKPWLWGGLAVLGLSLLFWTPFVIGITRYVGHLTRATGQIAAGRFDVTIQHSRRDELGQLGRSILSMAGRLDILVRGQKRFLGDVAHELCSPLARIRTGLSVLETKMPDTERDRLADIDADAAELASLVEELLAFSRISNRPASLELCEAETLIREALAREGEGIPSNVNIPPGLLLRTDARMLARALGNLIRNTRVHAGPRALLTISACKNAEAKTAILTVADNGPGVPEEELPRIFEPFYRPDRSRTRETGGSGLGLAIVKSCVEACGGTVSAANGQAGGFVITLELPMVEADAG